jgi:hypothetical protein
MAAQIAHDVVKEAQSMGASSPIGDIETSTSPVPADSGLETQSKDQPVVYSSTASKSINGDDESIPDTIFLTGPRRELSKSPFGDKASLLAEASGGSDTDTSKPDSLSRKDSGGTGHARSNSVKKPTSFKSVSVTKNFLAKAAVSTPTSRPGEKSELYFQRDCCSGIILTPEVVLVGQSTANSTLKPRLVAKSALGGLSSRSGVSSGAGAGAGPDASKVWNKNRRMCKC